MEKSGSAFIWKHMVIFILDYGGQKSPCLSAFLTVRDIDFFFIPHLSLITGAKKALIYRIF